MREAIGHRLDRVLAIAVQKTFLHAFLDPGHQIADFDQFDHALDLLPRHESQPHFDDDAEQPVAADHQAEQLAVLGSAACVQIAFGVDQFERLDVADNRLEAQAASMGVRRQRAGNRDEIDARLFLPDAPLLCGAALRAMQIA